MAWLESNLKSLLWLQGKNYEVDGDFHSLSGHHAFIATVYHTQDQARLSSCCYLGLPFQTYPDSSASEPVQVKGPKVINSFKLRLQWQRVGYDVTTIPSLFPLLQIWNILWKNPNELFGQPNIIGTFFSKYKGIEAKYKIKSIYFKKIFS